MEIDEIESYIEGGLEAIKGFKVPKSEEGGIVSEKQLIYIGHYTEENDREVRIPLEQSNFEKQLNQLNKKMKVRKRDRK